MQVLGIDIGGSGIKAAVVDTQAGEIITERHRLDTPQPATPEALLASLSQIISHFSWHGPIGCGFPGVVRQNIVRTAFNLDPALVGFDLGAAIRSATGCPATILNDADAAGWAEMRFGEGRAVRGSVLLLTFGTGVGSVLFANGTLVANTELGHLIHKGKDAELMLSERARKRDGLSWKQWARRLDGYLKYLEFLFSPELFILGGGGVKKPEKFQSFLTVSTPVTIARYGNRAGIVGAALAASLEA